MDKSVVDEISVDGHICVVDELPVDGQICVVDELPADGTILPKRVGVGTWYEVRFVNYFIVF